MNRLFYVLLALLLAGSGLQAQQKVVRTVKGQAQVDSLKQYYLDRGIPEEWAEKRAQTVWQKQHAVQTRSFAYNANPVAGSIWLDRDSVAGTQSASHAHDFTPEEFVKDIFVKGGREIADEAIRNVTLISSSWTGSPSTTWNNKGYTGSFGGDAGTWSSNDRELLYFDHGDTTTTIPGWNGDPVPLFGISKGFLLSTGPGLLAEGDNYDTGALGGGYGENGASEWSALHGGVIPPANQRDPDLSPIASDDIETFTSLEFDFRPFVDSISFRYVFCSEEFPDYANDIVNDIFGFFVSGPGLTDEWGNTGDTINIARFPNGASVTINNSNWGKFGFYNSASTPQYDAVSPEYHVPVYAGSSLMEYDGHSIVLTARAKVIPGQWYHLKLAISNVVDAAYGSGVFLEAGSLDLGAPESEVARPYIKSEYDSIYGYSSLYANCINQLLLTFNAGTVGHIAVWSQGSGANYVYDADGGASFRDTVRYPIAATDTAVMINFKVAENVPDGSSLFFFSQLSGSPKKDTSELFTLYAKSTFELTRFIPNSLLVSGMLEIATAKGSPYIQRSIDGGRSWEFARDTLTGKDLPFTPLQIEQITDLKEVYILYREPNTCCSFDSVFVAVPVAPPPTISRQVTVPEIPGAVTSPPAGVHHVRSTENFVLTVIPDPENTGRELSVKVIRRDSHSDDGVTVTPNPDGSYTVTVLRVQENIHLDVTFIDPLVDNAAVEPAGIRTDGSQLYIRASRSGEAHIYSISGTRIQTVALKAGETAAVPLPKGFYLVTAEDKTYKIIIR
jgi:hypothetical protein